MKRKSTIRGSKKRLEEMDLQIGDKIRVYYEFTSSTSPDPMSGLSHKGSEEGYYRGLHSYVNNYYYRDMIKAYNSPSSNRYPAILITDSFEQEDSRNVKDLINNTDIGSVYLLGNIDSIKILKK